MSTRTSLQRGAAGGCLTSVVSRGTHISGQPRHSHQWAAEALSSVGSRGTLISGQPRHSHQWAAEALTILLFWGFSEIPLGISPSLSSGGKISGDAGLSLF